MWFEGWRSCATSSCCKSIVLLPFHFHSWLRFLSNKCANDTLSFAIFSSVTFVMDDKEETKENTAATVMGEVETGGCVGCGWDVNQVGINTVCHVAEEEEMAVAVSTPNK